MTILCKSELLTYLHIIIFNNYYKSNILRTMNFNEEIVVGLPRPLKGNDLDNFHKCELISKAGGEPVR